MLGEELNSVTNAFGLRGLDECVVALTMFKARAEAPSLDPMCCPGCSLCGLLVRHCHCSWQGHGGSIEVIQPKHLCKGTEFGVDVGASK